MSGLRGLLVAVSTVAVLAAGCGGAEVDSGANESAGSEQDSRSRAKPGFAQVASGPIEPTETIEPVDSSLHAPYMTATVDSLGTIETLETKNGPKYPAQGETFYAIDLTVEADRYDLELAPKFPNDKLAEFPQMVVRTKARELRIDTHDQSRIPETPEQVDDSYTVVASGTKSDPPTLAIGPTDSPVLEYDLTVGKSTEDTVPRDLELDEQHRLDVPVDAGIFGTTNVEHSITFSHARLASSPALLNPDQDRNLLIITAERYFALGEPENPGEFSEPELIYYPRDSVRIVDAKGKVYKQDLETDPYRDEPQEDLASQETEEVHFVVKVPRNQTEFTLEYQPVLAFYHQTSKFELDPTRIELDFAQR